MLAAPPPVVAALGGLAVVVAAASGSWNDNLGDEGWFLRILVVGIVSWAALAGARARAAEADVQDRLSAVLANLAEAVTVQDLSGRVVYANQAAADLFGVPGARELVAASVEELAARLTITGEDGREVPVEDLPGPRILAGQLDPPAVLVRVCQHASGRVTWHTVRATAVHSRRGVLRYAVNVLDDVTVVKRAEMSQRVLAEAGAVLAGPLDVRARMQALAGVVAGDLADGCTLEVVDGDETPGITVAAGDTEAAPTTELPLEAGGRRVGTMTVIGSLAPDDLAVARELARRAATVVWNTRLYEERVTTAETLQRELLPPDLPVLEGWTTASLYRAAGEVGGDFYDAFETQDGLMFVIGDVAGRGPSAASLTAMARHTLRTAGILTGDPGTAMSLLNQALLDRPRMSLVSACLVHARSDGRLAVLCAGHPPPFLVRDGRAAAVPAGGPLLGAVDQRPAWPAELVDPGDGALVLYTDGIIDAHGGDGRFGEDRLRAALDGAGTPAAAVDQVRAALDAFADPERRDDMAVLAIARRPAREHRAELPIGPAAPRTARRLVEEWLEPAVGRDQLDRAKLLVSELVTNGVRHVAHHEGDVVELRVQLGAAAVRIEVRDPGRDFRPARTIAPPPDAVGGRGLLIVDRVASRWGVVPGPRTCVWFELDR